MYFLLKVRIVVTSNIKVIFVTPVLCVKLEKTCLLIGRAEEAMSSVVFVSVCLSPWQLANVWEHNLFWPSSWFQISVRFEDSGNDINFKVMIQCIRIQSWHHQDSLYFSGGEFPDPYHSCLHWITHRNSLPYHRSRKCDISEKRERVENHLLHFPCHVRHNNHILLWT